MVLKRNEPHASQLNWNSRSRLKVDNIVVTFFLTPGEGH